MSGKVLVDTNVVIALFAGDPNGRGGAPVARAVAALPRVFGLRVASR